MNKSKRLCNNAGINVKCLSFLNKIGRECMVFQQPAGIPMGTNCDPLLADLFLHYYEADFIADLIRMKEHRLARSFNLSFRYIDNVLSLNNPSFGDLIHRFAPTNLR